MLPFDIENSMPKPKTTCNQASLIRNPAKMVGDIE